MRHQAWEGRLMRDEHGGRSIHEVWVRRQGARSTVHPNWVLRSRYRWYSVPEQWYVSMSSRRQSHQPQANTVPRGHLGPSGV